MIGRRPRLVRMGGTPLEPGKVAAALGKCTGHSPGRGESVDESRKLWDEITAFRDECIDRKLLERYSVLDGPWRDKL